MQTVLYKAGTRGHANHGWLETYHTFSFAGYHDPGRVHFGALRVLNDDAVSPGMGFGKHPHENMEIISIPLEGALEHKDSMGNTTVIEAGDIQVMSAGTGVYHSEYNKNEHKAVKFLQIWVFPNKKNVEPRYGQIKLKEANRHNKLQEIVSPDGADGSVWIHQNAWFYLGKLDKGISLDYQLRNKSDGVYTFLLNGKLDINGQELGRRDGLGITETSALKLKALEDSEVLLMEVPMEW